jgi:inosine-uridine nucleoside N-ribohydrolase
VYETAWAKPYYLPPFSFDEAQELLQTLGGTMGVQWDDRALDAVYSESGGHPFLLRDLASTVVTHMPLTTTRRTATRSDVTRRLGSWRRQTAANVQEILSHIARYYPTEQVLLDILLEDPSAFSELVDDEQTAVYHLIQLGLIVDTDGDGFTPSPLVDRSRP